MRLKKVKRVLSGLVATAMTMSCFAISVAAEGDTTNAEVAYSLKYLDSLPKNGEPGFDRFLKLPNTEKLDSKRTCDVKHENGTIEKVVIDEKMVYGEIENKVKDIEGKVDKGEFENEITDDSQKNEYKKMSREMKIARAIYEWVADTIRYDHETYENIKRYYKDRAAYDVALNKPQDALFVYKQQLGVCSGKAELTVLMMKMAKIPSAYIGTTEGKDGLGHAYNAIYLEDGNDGRKGWTLLDSTWGATNSDKDSRINGGNITNKLIKDKTYYHSGFINDVFNRDDEYTKEIIKILQPDGKKAKSDDEIFDVNYEIKKKLKELNEDKKFANDFHFKNIKLVKGDYGIDAEYETDLNEAQALEIQNKAMEAALLKRCTQADDLLFDWGEFGKLNYELLSGIRSLVRVDENGNSERYEAYTNEIDSTLCKQVFKDYDKKQLNDLILKDDKVNLQKVIDEINEKIRPKLGEINAKFKDINTLKAFSVYLDSEGMSEYSNDEKWCALCARAEISLDSAEFEKMLNEEKERVRKEEKERVRNTHKKFFPVAYDATLDFKSDNETIIKNDTHKIKEIYSSSDYEYNYRRRIYDELYRETFIMDGAKYELDGQEGNSYIKLYGMSSINPAKEVTIPSDIVKSDITFKIGSGIESLNLQGDEVIDISEARDLKNINADESNKYTTTKSRFYNTFCDKNTNEIIKKFFNMGSKKTEEGIEYTLGLDNQRSKISEIYFYLEFGRYKNAKIPEYLTQLNVPIKIFGGIESLILERDEILDLLWASDLKSIDITKSTRYEEKDGKVIDKILKTELEFPQNSKIEIINSK